MNIVLCNKYFFLNGGTEKYLSVLLRHLTAHGHRALPFSVRYAGSWESPYSRYFLDPPGDPAQTHLNTITLRPSNCLRFLSRSIYSLEARRKLALLLDAEGPVDVGYVLNIYNYMSPSVIDACAERGIPVVMQIGDYHLLCPAYTLLRGGIPCTRCITGSYHYGLWHRCVKKKLPASAVRVAAMYVHKWIGVYKRVAAFVVPCAFMKEMLERGGFPGRRIRILPYPVPPEDLPERLPAKKNYILYFGRISHEKGIDTLIRAYQRLGPPVDLMIVGRNYDREEERLKSLVLPAFRGRIRFIPFLEGGALSDTIAQALCTVVPSRWYDNAPISIYESFAHATPVVAARIGGIPEQVQENVTGKLFTPNDDRELAEALAWMLADRNRLLLMGAAGRSFVERHLAVERHVQDLTALFMEIKQEAARERRHVPA